MYVSILIGCNNLFPLVLHRSNKITNEIKYISSLGELVECEDAHDESQKNNIVIRIYNINIKKN
jgi:hypothetical protein